MKKDMIEYMEKHYLGGLTKSGKQKHNTLADKNLKKPMYSEMCYNTKDYSPITWSKTEYNGNYRVCSGVKRKPVDIYNVLKMRIKLLANRPNYEYLTGKIEVNGMTLRGNIGDLLRIVGWLENPSKIITPPDKVSKLKNHKLVKTKR